ncbi:MAG: HAMP domain-containing sensor histidine kinase [Frisingicoccus sp.]|nr:HAMP domain-containing sensor histidine kinase [Frisingicoccus sp.]
MKLRTKILLISCLAVLTAILFSEVMILGTTARNLKNETELKGYQNFYELINEMNPALSDVNGHEMKKTWMEYFFKTRKQGNERYDYTICFYQDVQNDGETKTVEIYNHTELTWDDLSKLDYGTYNAGFAKSEMIREGHSYTVFAYEGPSGFFIYQIVDMDGVFLKIKQLALYMAILTAGVLTVTIGILYFLLKRMLWPLQELNETTKKLAEGAYDQRVPVRRKDEIGELEESFNKMAEAIQKSRDQLETSEKQKTLFMGNLTHELKTPMTAISGYAQTLLTVRLDPEDEAEALHYIYEECMRLERLSKKMMKLLELDQDLEIVLKDTPVRVLFEASEKACTTILREKDIRLEWNENGEHYPMDLDLMTDVMINLIDNAAKASQSGSRILLKSYEQCIEVQDFGRGIPEEEKEKILEPFYMIDKSRSRKNGGAGLGLALTSIILKYHHVDLKIESTVGEGTRMILQFDYKTLNT